MGSGQRDSEDGFRGLDAVIKIAQSLGRLSGNNDLMPQSTDRPSGATTMRVTSADDARPLPRDSEALPKVLVVGQGPPTTGGIPTYVTELMADPWLRSRVHMDYLNTHPRGVKRPGKLTLANLLDALTHAWTVFGRATRADIVHLNLAATPGLPMLRALLLCAAAKAAGAGVILHAHSNQLEWCLPSLRFRFLIELGSPFYDRLIAVSQVATAQLGEFRPAVVRKTLHLKNGVDHTMFRSPPKDADPPILSFAGTISERKGLIDLRDALLLVARDYPGNALPVRVLIAGDGRQEGPGAFERMTRAYAEVGLDEVEFLGSLERKEVIDLLARTDIFCFPSYLEGAPLSVLEAMASGTAVISTKVADIPSMLDHGRAGILIEPGDVAALAGSIKRLLDDPHERARMGNAARRRIEDEYSQAVMIGSLYHLYLEIVEERGNRQSAVAD